MIDDDLIIPVLAIGGPLLLIGFNIAAKTFTRVVGHWRDTSLKIRLVEAGLSPADIERVVAAGTKGANRQARLPHSKESKAPVGDKPPIHVDMNRNEASRNAAAAKELSY